MALAVAITGFRGREHRNLLALIEWVLGDSAQDDNKERGSCCETIYVLSTSAPAEMRQGCSVLPTTPPAASPIACTRPGPVPCSGPPPCHCPSAIRVLRQSLHEKLLLKWYRQRRLASLVGSVARGKLSSVSRLRCQNRGGRDGHRAFIHSLCQLTYAMPLHPEGMVNR